MDPIFYGKRFLEFMKTAIKGHDSNDAVGDKDVDQKLNSSAFNM